MRSDVIVKSWPQNNKLWPLDINEWPLYTIIRLRHAIAKSYLIGSSICT
jgi:hypothetical protein